MSDRAYIATRKGLFEVYRTHEAWLLDQQHFLGDPVSMVLPDRRDGTLYAALNLGHFGVKLHASDDEGRGWNEIAVPTYPEQPADAAGPAWKLALLWSLEAVGGEIWAGTIPGGLFASADGGESWRLNEALWQRPERAEWFGGGYDAPGIHSICAHPARPREALVAVSCGGAWLTQDAGAHWSVRTRGMAAAYMPPDQAENPAIQDPHRIVRCEAAPDVLWCQHHNGIWRSVDNAASWQEIEAPVSSFGFAVAAHPQDRDTAWFVPAMADERRVPRDGALVVNRTRDGGRSFETLRRGLPQADCHDLVYRHGLAVSADGRSLLMGSTTGGLWASDDAGDSWTLLPARLPPIYAVRFG